jgi:hypothetical protein
MSPPPLQTVGFSGKMQVRSITQRGFTWEETWGLLDPADQDVRELMALIRTWHRAGTVVDVEHPSITKLGAGGSGNVQGGSQTGSSITTDGWPGSTWVLRAGDFIRFGSETGSHEITTDVLSTAGGVATIGINPPIFVGHSPNDNSAVEIADAGVASFRMRIVSMEMPTAGANISDYIAGMKIRFFEAI